MAKSSKKKDPVAAHLPQSHPLAGRKTLYSLQDQSGEVVVLDQANFGIQTANSETVLLPLNLPSAFKKSGVRIKFNGQAKETALSEFWAGQPFLLTKIERSN